jgi:hypothetical protein
MSGYDFHHGPTPKELLEGLADAYRRELKRVGGSYPTRAGTWKMSVRLVLPPELRATALARLAPLRMAEDRSSLFGLCGRPR